MSIPLDSIAELHVRRLDPGKSVLGVLAGGAITIGLLALVVALTKESCPLVYAVTSEGEILEGELYSGAVLPELERTDVLRLRELEAVDGLYTLRLSNEARETHYTDRLSLLAVDHAPGIDVLPGADGTLHTVRQPVSPIAAVDGLGRDATGALAAVDDSIWVPEPYDRDLGNSSQLRDAIMLRFPVEPGATRAKLVVRIRNTEWADHVVGRFLGLMGDMMEAVYLGDGPGAQRTERMEDFLRGQGLVLNAAVAVGDGWVDAGYLHPTGPVGWQEEVLEIPVPEGTDTLTVRLESGALFWLLDHAAVDYSANEPLRVHVLAPLETEGGEAEAVALLTASDDLYQVLPDRGHSVLVRYAAPDKDPALDRSLLVESEGYYLIHRKQESAPDFATLAAIQSHPDGFLRWSLEEFWHTTGYGEGAETSEPEAMP